ncbi:NAD(+) synthase [Fuchsiella alkaliacetigena]|uniref:NAD(+) synthase n=1 Tax=Fuchsiella alkaliacetigena TaxID=957042 RepID=UPI00200B591F|nr:NAD(+) synthase [Fuchsiella alkaliacetigena]MCK8824620.1 NAD(+) synthase [Fuchsiella alkaliacetigena]
MKMRDYAELSNKLIKWIRKQVAEVANCQGTVVGLSGGIDSAVTAVLCQQAFPENNLGLIMPCHSQEEDAEDAKLVAEKFSIKVKTIDLAESFDLLLKTLKNAGGFSQENKLAIANIKPRLRMTVLYYYASCRDSLVVGTDNRSELKVGYFTKYGDGGVDIAPLANLVKTEVYQLAEYLEIPAKIINRAPSAGLWNEQTDEEELGITYQQLDRYILTGEAEPEIRNKIESLAAQSSHKLALPPTPDF